jgi:hypothetical protein
MNLKKFSLFSVYAFVSVACGYATFGFYQDNVVNCLNILILEMGVGASIYMLYCACALINAGRKAESFLEFSQGTTMMILAVPPFYKNDGTDLLVQLTSGVRLYVWVEYSRSQLNMISANPGKVPIVTGCYYRYIGGYCIVPLEQ